MKPLEEIADLVARAVAGRARALIDHLGMTQEAFARATKGLLKREEVNSLCNGKFKTKGVRVPEAIQAVVGVPLDSARRYLIGELSIGELERTRIANIAAGYDPPLKTFLQKLEDTPLRSEAIRRKAKLSETQAILRLHDEGSLRTYARPSDGQPDWARVFDDLHENKLLPSAGRPSAEGVARAAKEERRELGGRLPKKLTFDPG